MLKTLRLKNFKLHEDATFELGRITVLIGPQGVGKSSVIQTLSLLRQSAGKEGLFDGRSDEGRTFQNVIHGVEQGRLLSFGVELSTIGAPYFLSDTGELDVSYGITFDNSGFREQQARFVTGKRTLDFRAARREAETLPENIVAQNCEVSFSASRHTLYPFRFKQHGENHAVRKGINDLRLSIYEYFHQVQMVPESHVIDRNRYPKVASSHVPPRDIGQVVNRLADEWDAKDELSDNLARIVGREIDFRPNGNEVLIETKNPAVDMLGPVMCEGGGLRALVWPLASLAFASPGSLITIEEPEIHLHPKALRNLSEVFARVCLEKDVQLLLTTHNEHLVLSLLLAVAEGKLDPEQLAIYSLGEESGRSIVSRLQVDEKGGVEGGLQGFFEASVDELGQYLAALQDREKAE